MIFDWFKKNNPGVKKTIGPDWVQHAHDVVNRIILESNPSICSYIVLHHSLSDDGNARNWDAVKKWHIKVNGWKDIGYHFGIEKINNRYCVLKGRGLNVRGAHVKQGHFNWKSIGICFIGNYDNEELPVQMWTTGLFLCDRLMDHLKIYEVRNIIGHREAQRIANYANPKSCPGKRFHMEQFREDLKNYRENQSLKFQED